MKPKKDKNLNKTLDKSEKKVKPKVKTSKSPRLESQPKANVLTSDRICNRCKVHDMIRSVKGHKCPDEVLTCLCDKCMDYVEKTRRKNENRKRRLMEKNAGKDKSKTDTKSFVKSLKNKSKKILNSSKKKGRPTKHTNGVVETDQPSTVRFSDNPPSLQPQTDEEIIPQSDSSNTDINQSNKTDTEPEVSTSSAPLCAKYLKACEELSRKLSKAQLTQDELIACFKYSMIRDCLGDVEMAAQKIVFASQEIRLGAVYNIQHPSEDQNNPRPHTSTSNVPVLCSTYNAQYVPNSGVHYSPSFTPIRRK